MADLRQVIAATLSPHTDIRKIASHRYSEKCLASSCLVLSYAERQLSELQKNPAHPLEVLRLVASSDASDAAVRQASAVHFKNLVKNGWDVNREDGTNGIVISEQDRNTIKSHLVQLMCTVPQQIQAQVSESISLVAAVDYPEKWNNLMPELVQQFNSPDMAVVNGVLKTANSICKQYRYVARSDTLYRSLAYTLQHIQAPLLTLFISTGKAVDALAGDPAQLLPRFAALRSMARIFYSLNYQDLPEFFEDHMGEWLAEFAKYLQYKNPALVDDSEEMEPGPIDSLQAAIVQNLSLYADKDEEEFIPSLPQFTTLVWNLLISLTALAKHDNLVTTSIRFLSSLISKQMHQDIFKEEATLRQIITQIVIPNLMVREIDEERFEDDPKEFILTEIEGSDSESRRKCSQDLLRAMCRQFEAKTTSICSEHVGTMLSQFAADPSKWAAKDAAINLMLGIAVRLESKQGVSEVNENVNVMEFFTSHVFPELQDGNHENRPMVKATAVKFVSTFRNQFSREQLVALSQVLINHLGSPSVVVHTYAAYAIERILMAKDTDTVGSKLSKVSNDDIKPFLENLFTGLFNIVDNTEWNENEFVMKCIMRSLAKVGEEVIPITTIVFDKLSTALGRVCKNPRNPMFNHYLFESIAVLVRSVCSKDMNMIQQLEALLFPPFQTVLQMEIVEFTPYVFQILAQLLEFSQVGAPLSDSYKALLQPLITPALWEQKGNIPALTRLLQAYMRKAGAEVVSMGLLMGILGVFQKLVSSKATETSAFGLLESITLHVPRESLSPHVKTIFNILLVRLQGGKTSRYVRLLTHYFAIFIGKFGATSFFDAMNSIQPGVALNLMVGVWIPRLATDSPVRLDAKIQVVGLTRLLCDTPALLEDDNGKKIWAQILACVVSLITSPSWSLQQAEDGDFGEAEIGYDSTFSKLSYASKPAEDPFADVTDPVESFVRSLHSLSAARPGVLAPIIQANLSSDPKLGPSLQAMFQKAGLHL